jgi:hypothetical protein
MSDPVVDQTLERLKSMTHENQCEACKGEILDSFAIADDKKYHVSCFICKRCQKTLAGKSYIGKEDSFYCEDCYHLEFSPKCAFCSEPIKGQYISALGKTWHQNHFVCAECHKPFDSDHFKKKDQNPYHAECYEKLFTVLCEKCSLPIKDKTLTTQNHHYHPSCFTCAVDDAIIPETQPFHIRNDKLYCDLHFRSNFIKICTSCKKDITDRFINVLDKYFHEECFTCASCSASLVGKQVEQQDGLFVCKEHHKQDVPILEEKDEAAPVLEEKVEAAPVLEQKVEAAPVLEQKVEARAIEKIGHFYPYEVLVQKENLPSEVNIAKREDYLSDDDFLKVFKMQREDFEKLALWKQKQLKKN